MASYGYCDSYFVEDHDEDRSFQMRAQKAREAARASNKIKQKKIAEELSRLTADEYEEDILDHMEMMELETMPDINSIEIQTEIQWYMRPYLLDFLLEAHHAFQLLPETLFLTVNLLDRYCSRRVVYKRHYQLVGCAALLIAAKYGDRKERVPTIRELKSMCCSLYDDDMFTQMEWHVLQTLNWIVGHPTVSSFLQVAMSELAADAELEHMALYISELALYNKEFISVTPSIMARSSLALATYILGRRQPHSDQWSSIYDRGVVMALSDALIKPTGALARKYASPNLSGVSTKIETFLAQQAMLAQKRLAEARSLVSIVTTGCSSDENIPSSMVDSCHLSPQTPQKPGYSTAFSNTGILTPPITPDSNYTADQCFAAAQMHMMPRHPACASTPPHDMTSSMQFMTYYDNAHSRYVH